MSESDLDTDGDKKPVTDSVKRAKTDKGKAIEVSASGACSCGKPPTVSHSQGKTNIEAREGPSAARDQDDTLGFGNTDNHDSRPSSKPPTSTHRTTATQHESRCGPGAVLLLISLCVWFITTLVNGFDGPGLGFFGVLVTIAIMTPVALGVVLLGLGLKADANVRYERVLDAELEHVGDRPVRVNRRGMVWGLTEGDIGSACVMFGAMLLVVAASAMLATALGSESHPSVQESAKQNVTKLVTKPSLHD